MIRLLAQDLPDGAIQQLRKYQKEVDKAGSFSAKVAAAKALFKQRNTTKNATFRAIRETLDQMCSGVRRCCYCEDSVADEVEHIKPKHWYPEAVFAWENYLYACGPCNGPKNNKFSVFHKKNGQIVHLERTKDDPIRKPPPGDPLLIDPRTEDPLEFLELDLSGTFLFLPREGLEIRGIKRAKYTIELLKLNARDVLTRSRRNAFGTYLARLEQYTIRKKAGAQLKDLLPLIEDLRLVPHPTVWKEMKRQASDYPRLKNWFKRTPEAMNW